MTAVPGLSLEGCRARQGRLLAVLKERNLAAALIADRRHVHYFSGYWTRDLYSPLLFVESDGPTTLVVPHPPGPADSIAADVIIPYESARMGTLVDDQPCVAAAALGARLARGRTLGCDRIPSAGLAERVAFIDLTADLLALRRRKDADEVQLQCFGIGALEDVYGHVRQMLAPGVSEMDLFAEVHRVVAARVGEAVGEIGNDFQVGALGSAPRRRAAILGEVAILDLSVTVRGYASDMCRSFVVGGRPCDAQVEAHGRILEALEEVERSARAGVRGHDLDAGVRAGLDGYHGWTFKHHLGHGIGLANHEAPRLNPNWEDVLQAGDVFAAEPGLYGESLRAGIRIEQMYLVTDTGLQRLTTFPTNLV